MSHACLNDSVPSQTTPRRSPLITSLLSMSAACSSGRLSIRAVTSSHVTSTDSSNAFSSMALALSTAFLAVLASSLAFATFRAFATSSAATSSRCFAISSSRSMSAILSASFAAFHSFLSASSLLLTFSNVAPSSVSVRAASSSSHTGSYGSQR